MTLQTLHRKAGHDRVERARFLSGASNVFTQRADESSWPRWRDTWKAAHHYLDGLLLPGSGKNMDRLARGVDVPVGEIERFVRESPWEAHALQTHLMTRVPDAIRSHKAALIVDDVAGAKKGRHSVGVAHQYSGAAGKLDNCQVAVDLVVTTPGKDRNADQKTWPLGMRLYLSRDWVEAPEHADLRDEVALPEDVRFQTKPQIALAMIDEARAAQVPHAVTLGDAGYGDDGEFRRGLRERKEPYILGVNPSTLRVIDARVPVHTPPANKDGGRPPTHLVHPEGVERESPKQIADRIQRWTTVEWSEGTKTTLTGRFHRTKVRVVEGAKENRWATDEAAWLLFEQRDNELKAYLCWGLDDDTLEELVAKAHLRWAIEQFHREAKGLLGLDRFEGRKWNGWNHHAAMVLLAYAYLCHLRAHADPQHPLPTLPETLRQVVLASLTIGLMEDQGLKRPQAEQIAGYVLRRNTDW